MPLFYFFSELLLLFLVSKVLVLRLSTFFYFLTKNTRIASIAISLLFFPGTLLHETAHYIFAKLLFVPTGKIYLIPKFSEKTITLGSVEIAESNVLFRFMIGFAPLLFGTFFIIGVM